MYQEDSSISVTLPVIEEPISSLLVASEDPVNDENDVATTQVELQTSTRLNQNNFKNLEVEAPVIGNKVSALTYDVNYSPLCTKLNINTLYKVAITAGNTYCIYFDIPTNSRTQFLAQQQTATRQIHADLFQDIPGNYTFTLLNSSNSSGSEDNILQYTEAGHYYYQFYATSSDGGNIQVVAAVNTSIDQYEPNDTLTQSKRLESGKYNKTIAHIDNPAEYDYFNYHAAQGQDVVVGLYDDHGTHQWKLELLQPSGWQELDLNQRWDLHNLDPNTVINIRVRHDDSKPFVASYYRLLFGPKISDITDYEVNAPDNEVLIRMTYVPGHPYYTSQVHKNMDWRIKVLDSENQPIEGVKVNLLYGTTDLGSKSTTDYTSNDGYVRKSESLPACSGNVTATHQENFGPYAGTYKTEFDVGAWIMVLPDTTADDDIGVGSPTGNQVTLAHICKQTLQ